MCGLAGFLKNWGLDKFWGGPELGTQKSIERKALKNLVPNELSENAVFRAVATDKLTYQYYSSPR